jgi:serine/threonine protein phosphatase 1
MRQGDHGQHGEIAFTLPVVVEQQVEVETTGVAKEEKLMSKTYAIADLHGRFDLLEMALACIAKRAEPPATLVTLGDYVDRGPDSRKIIERLMVGLEHDGWKLICLKGNHEDIMWQTCRRLPSVGWWLTNGGGATLISYGQQLGDQVDVTIVPAPHLDWVERLPLMYVDRHRVFVHAGIDPNCPLDEQDAENVIWKIYPDDDDGGHGQRHVVHGHHQHVHGPIFKKHRTNLDTLAWYTGRLAIGVFDDAAPGGPIEVLEVHGEPFEKMRRRSKSPLATKRRADEALEPATGRLEKRT